MIIQILRLILGQVYTGLILVLVKSGLNIISEAGGTKAVLDLLHCYIVIQLLTYCYIYYIVYLLQIT